MNYKHHFGEKVIFEQKKMTVRKRYIGNEGDNMYVLVDSTGRSHDAKEDDIMEGLME